MMIRKSLQPKSKRRYERCLSRLRCNLCRKLFRPGNKLDRFCRACKTESELFRFHEWLPATT
ncbi:MAG: hypothetical protein NDJ90_10290 [Oligoflexia bacterium]|nr:hypothetical protein [Oligoflexia bacterium]